MKIKTLKILTILSILVGTYNLVPKYNTKQFMRQKKGDHLAFVLDEKNGSPKTQIQNSAEEYIMKNDEAVVFWRGGPILSDGWYKIQKDYAYKFGKSEDSKDTHKKTVKGNYSVPFDVYLGTQVQWHGSYLKEYFEKELKASNVKGFINQYSQRAVTLKDVAYFKNKANLQNTKIAIKQMLDDQVELMFTLAKELKEAGYKKVHFIGHSFGSFLVNEFIQQKGDDAFKYVDSIRAIATRFKATEKQVQEIDGKTFPYFIYNEKSKDYTKQLKLKVQKNAITKGVVLSIFEAMTKKNYIEALKNLSKENKKKYAAVWTKFDFRIGSMSKEELALRDEGINILEIPTEELITYNKKYLSQKDYSKKTNVVPKTKLIDKGINHHDLLLRWYLDNTFSKYNSKSWLTKEVNIKDSRSYWCDIPTDEIINCADKK